jgi:hypothetical protein
VIREVLFGNSIRFSFGSEDREEFDVVRFRKIKPGILHATKHVAIYVLGKLHLPRLKSLRVPPVAALVVVRPA